jgi:hypothetical protein
VSDEEASVNPLEDGESDVFVSGQRHFELLLRGCLSDFIVKERKE